MPSPESSPFTTYAESPLGMFLTQTLKDIDNIQKKYPKSSDKALPKEAIKAQELVEATKTLLKTLHKDILPKFSEGNMPNILLNAISFVFSILKLNNLKKSINAQENALNAELSKKLVAYIETAKQDTSTPLTQSINHQLETNKVELFKPSEKKHHKELEAILQTVKLQISELDLDAWRDDDAIDISNHINQHLSLELLTPRHPMTYELLETMAELINNLPDSLAETISFFDPQVVTKMVANDIIAGRLRKHAGVTRVTHIPNYDSNEHSFSYTYTKESSSTDEGKKTPPTIKTKTRDLSAEYPQKRSDLLNEIMIPATRRYLATYGQQHSVDYPSAASVIQEGFKAIESDIARAEILQELTQFEDDVLEAPVIELRRSTEAFFTTTPTPTIDDLERLQTAHNELILMLSQKKTAYLSTTVGALLQEPGKTAILDRFNEHKATLDVEYSTKPLPYVLRCATISKQSLAASVISIGRRLASTIDASIEELQDSCSVITDKMQALEQESFDSLFTQTFLLFNPESLSQNLAVIEIALAAIKEEISKFTEELSTAKTQLPTLKEELAIVASQMPQKIEEQRSLQDQCDSLGKSIVTVLDQVKKNNDAKDENTRLSEDYKQLLLKLPQVKAILETDLEDTTKKPKVSFSAIDVIMAPKDESTSEHHGFISLLAAIDEMLIPKWRSYYKKQEDRFSAHPAPIEFKQIVSDLMVSIGNKIPMLADAMQQRIDENSTLDSEKTLLHQDLRTIDHELEPIYNLNSRRLKDIAAFDKQSAEIARLENVCDTTTHEIERLDKKEIQLKDNKNVLTQLLDILLGLDSLKTDISQVIETAGIDVLLETMARLKVSRDLLTQKIATTSSAIEKLEDPASISNYQANITAIFQLKNTLSLKIEQLSINTELKHKQATIIKKEVERTQMVKDAVIHLDNYLGQRAAKYNVKDFFSSKDKKIRANFINALRGELNGYRLSGNSDVVLATIRTNIARFPGIRLKPLLNRITVALFDAKDSPLNNPNVPDKTTTQHDEAIIILENLRKKYSGYAKNIDMLYEKIELMKNYGLKLTHKKDACGVEVTDLALKLKKDTDQFITSNHGGELASLPSQPKYDGFREKFMARLHSKDDVMYEHRNKWLQIIGNIALILFIIPQLIYSKISTGHCSFFFANQKMKLINEIGKQAHELSDQITAGF